MNDLVDAFVSPTIDWWSLTPQIILLGAALVILLVTSLARRQFPAAFSTALTVAAGIATFVVSLVLTYDIKPDGARTTLNGAFGIDGFSLFFTALTALGVIATALVAHDYVVRHRLAAPELAALLLTSAAGAIVMASANDLIVLFLGLETLSIALYVLIALHVSRNDARESAIKYFVLGALSSAFFLYGIALIYGATGTTNLATIGQFFEEFVLLDEQLLLAGIALLLVGLAFKVAAAPFHMWAPDVYQGAPSPITGYLASIVKAAGFAALMRVLFVGFSQHTVAWTPILTGLAFVTMAVGAVLAIRQNDVKRMLAFSSISHAGFILIGVQAASQQGARAALFYLFTYSFMALGSFAVLTLISASRGASTASAASSTAATAGAVSRHDLSVYAGLANNRPVLALSFTVLLLAQAGVPLTSGFIGKFQVIAAAVEGRGYVLATVAMLTAVISAFAYLRVVLAMYAPEDATATAGANGTAAGTDSASTATDSAVTDSAAAGTSTTGTATDTATTTSTSGTATTTSTSGTDTALVGTVLKTPHKTPLTACLALVGFVGITVVAGIIPQFLISFAEDAVSLFTFS